MSLQFDCKRGFAKPSKKYKEGNDMKTKVLLSAICSAAVVAATSCFGLDAVVSDGYYGDGYDGLWYNGYGYGSNYYGGYWGTGLRMGAGSATAADRRSGAGAASASASAAELAGGVECAQRPGVPDAARRYSAPGRITAAYGAANRGRPGQRVAGRRACCTAGCRAGAHIRRPVAGTDVGEPGEEIVCELGVRS